MNFCPLQHNLPRVLCVLLHSPRVYVPDRRQCDSYNRLLREAIANEESAPRGDDLEALMDADGEDDKTYAAMGVAKTLSTVGYRLELGVTCMLTILQIVSSIDSSPEILAQVQEVISPIILETLEKKALGKWSEQEA